MDALMLVGGILAGVGVVFLILGVIFIIIGNGKKKYSAKTTGRVINMCKSSQSFNSGGDGNGAHFGVYVTGNPNIQKHNRCPVFTYSVNGMQFTHADDIAYDINKIKHMLQQPVDVYYDPRNPADAKLNVRSPLMVVGVIFLIVSLLFFVMGIAFVMS